MGQRRKKGVSPRINAPYSSSSSAGNNRAPGSSEEYKAARSRRGHTTHKKGKSEIKSSVLQDAQARESAFFECPITDRRQEISKVLEIPFVCRGLLLSTYTQYTSTSSRPSSSPLKGIAERRKRCSSKEVGGETRLTRDPFFFSTPLDRKNSSSSS